MTEEEKEDRNILFLYFKIAKMLHKNVKGKRCSYDIDNVISMFRREIRQHTKEDHLLLRSQSGNMYRCADFFYDSTLSSQNHVYYSHDRFFNKEFALFVQGKLPFNKLHRKEDSFEFEGNFYYKDLYFMYENKVYDKTNYCISENTGKLLDLRKDRECKNPFTGEYTRISLDDGTSFSNNLSKYHGFISVEVYNVMNNVASWLFPSMFTINGERFGYGWSLVLTEDELKNIEFKPTESHKKYFEDWARGISESTNLPLEEVKNTIRERLPSMCKFKIHVSNDFGKASSIAKRILRNVIKDRMFSDLSIFELREALKTCKKFIEDEKEVKKYVLEKGYIH